MSRDDLDVIDRLRGSVAPRRLDVPVTEIVRAGRRRRSDRVLALAVAAALIAIVFASRVGAGPTAAGFAVVNVDGRSVLAMMEPSSGMEPTIRPGQVVAVEIGAYADGTPGRGDVIGFRLTDTACGGPFLKRVIGIAGDTVEEREGVLFVNGAPLDEPRERHGTSLGPWTVEPGHVFVVGDHLANSNDSRYSLGQVPLDDVIGRVDLSLDVSDANVSPPPACVATP